MRRGSVNKIYKHNERLLELVEKHCTKYTFTELESGVCDWIMDIQ